ncbi:hypothetical protein D7Z26_10660 [Cohnella endophytica]|uniref:Uncharacterized protein n=1 Tax=Cohnella endophytica TaxID=2419778 RepID=A0A494XT89_9BACL|nr:hypothetical protein [Cohnella endophytica]RKP53851.1 hypothetical protein D7Z26_10660 [Cohnella endophytica]
MTLKTKAILSTLALSLIASSLGGLPLSRKGLAEKLGLSEFAYAAEALPEQIPGQLSQPDSDAASLPAKVQATMTGLPSGAFIGKLNAIHAALAAGDPADYQDVLNLQNEIAGLNDATDARLLDPIWNKIAAKLPNTVDKAAMKTSLFRLFKAVGSVPYDPQWESLEAIRVNPEYRATLKAIAEAAGIGGISMEDLVEFLFGDGAGLKGVEGTVADIMAGKSAIELFMLLGDKQGMTTVLLQGMGQLLGETGSYKFSAVLANLGVTPQDVQTMVFGFLGRLQKDEPAINAMTVAYLRTAATAKVQTRDDGRTQSYQLSIFGIEVPALALKWTKVSGDPEVSVAQNGVVTIPLAADKGSAVIRTSLINPYGGSAKVIFEQGITLRADDGEQTKFPVASLLERLSKLRAALLAGDPADAEAVRAVRDEIASWDAETGSALLDPLWKAIAAKLPATIDKEQAKGTLFRLVQAIGAISYDPHESELEAVLTNPEFRALLKAIGVAGGVKNLAADDLLVFLFGDGVELGGVEGAVRDRIAALSPEELLSLLGSQQGLAELAQQAMGELFVQTKSYKLSAALQGLGIPPQAILATVLGIQAKLSNGEAAGRALTVALIRSETTGVADVSEDGLTQRFVLKTFGVELPDSALRWTKVSGSSDVKVDAAGTITIPRKVETATAIVQAELVNPVTGKGKTIFVQEVTLKSIGGEVFPVEAYLARKEKLWAALAAGDPSDAQAVRKLRDEIAGLNVSANLKLIDPIWKPISAKLPGDANSTKLRTDLFKLFQDIGKLQYDSQASNLEALLANPDYEATLKAIGAAGGAKSLKVDDVLVFLFGDSENRGGVEGTVRDLMAKLKPKNLAALVDDAGARTAILNEAMGIVLADRENYGLSEALGNIGVKASDLRATMSNFQSKLKNEERADNALIVALFRSEAVPSVKVSSNGKRQDYSLSVWGVQLPSSSLKWSKVSGSKDVKVETNGTVTIPSKLASGKAVIQAAIVSSHGRPTQVIFRQEVTVGKVEDMDQIIKDLKEKLAGIEAKARKAKGALAKLRYVVDASAAGNDAVKRINDTDANKTDKQNAIKEAQDQVRKTVNAIITDVLGF